MRKNIDFIYLSNKESCWGFAIAGKAIKFSEVSEEKLMMIKKLLEICNGFFKPTKINYFLTVEPRDEPINVFFSKSRHHVKALDSIENEIISESGITFDEFMDNIRNIKTPGNSVMLIRRIDISGNVRFILEGKDEYIGKNSPKEVYASWDYEKDEMTADTYEPFMISMRGIEGWYQNNQKIDITSPAYYSISFCTDTDIWYEDTDIGRANRNRLRNVFKKLYDNFNVVGTIFVADSYGEKILKEIAFGEK